MLTECIYIIHLLICITYFSVSAVEVNSVIAVHLLWKDFCCIMHQGEITVEYNLTRKAEGEKLNSNYSRLLAFQEMRILKANVTVKAVACWAVLKDF